MSPHSHAGSVLALRAGELQAEIAPSVGGSIASFSRQWSEQGRVRTVHWLRPATPEALDRCDPLGMASFPLLPFCNRIRQGRAEFEGRSIRFPPNHPAEPSPHPLHGIGWQRPWAVETQEPARVVLRLEVEASEAWPWRFAAQQVYELAPGSLSVALRLTNRDTVAMPAGIGHHPYFPHAPGTRVQTGVAAMWRTDDEVMPLALDTGGPVAALREGVLLAELDLDNNFTGWERSATVQWPADAAGPARSVHMTAEAPLDYFVLYCPHGFDHFCAEPVSQCTDWLNLLPSHGARSVGGTRLAPGESLTARFTLQPHWQ